jgi:phosphoglycolate phosphatase
MLIVFDLDGTLIDSSRDLADATNALIEEYGGRSFEITDVMAMVGEGAAVLVRRALTASGLDPESPGALERFLTLYGDRLTHHTRPYDGILDVLTALRSAGRTLAVLTNKPQRATTTIMERLGLAPAFSDVVGGDTVAGRKPDPAALLQIVSRAASTPASTVLVGDSPVDLETARRAGTRICLARYGFGYRFGESAFRGDELFIDAPLELLSVLGVEVTEGTERAQHGDAETRGYTEGSG